MKNTEQLDKALHLLREADQATAPPDFLETRLRAAFREQHAGRQKKRWLWPLAAGVSVACAAAALFVVLRNPATVAAPETPQPLSAITTQPRPPVPERAAETATASPEAPVVNRAAKRPAPRNAPRPAARPVHPADAAAVTLASAPQTQEEFLKIPYAPPLTERGEVFRVSLSRQSIRSLGIPVNGERMPERVPADLLVGEDGVPRGIRLVQASDWQ